jgi:uncharacterized protein YgiM (DUF1202 family)
MIPMGILTRIRTSDNAKDTIDMNLLGSRFRPAAVPSIVIAVTLVAAMFATALSPVRHAGAADAFPLYSAVTVNTDALNIRATPGLGGIVTAVIPFGTLLAVEAGPTTAGGYDWYQITRLDRTLDGESGPDGWVAGEFLAQSGFAPGTVLQVTDGPVNLRDGASVKTDKLGSLDEGARLTVLTGPIPDGGYSWYQVTVENGDRGWVAGEFLGVVDSGGSSSDGYQAGDAVIVTDGPLNLRDTPSLSGAINRVVPTGATFSTADASVDADGYIWISVFSVTYGKGWVASDFIALDPAGTGGGEEGGA